MALSLSVLEVVQQPLIFTALAGFLYLVSLAVHRLWLSPLAAFPGPRLAALSNWYEFYYDVVQHGKFTAHIQELHKQYGPIIRITPTELHIDDPDYFDVLYGRGAGGPRDKSTYFAGRFGHASDSFSTVDHDLHRNRRKAIAPFFSAAKIEDFQPVIRAKVNRLCEKLSSYQDGQVVRLSRACMALTTDIITEYSFAKSYDQLESPDFEDTMHEALVAIYVTGHFALHFPIVFPILDLLPDWFVKWGQPEILPVVGLRYDLAKRIKQIRTGLNTAPKTASHPTIFHELLTSDLPPQEKTDARLGDEAQLIVCAGIITTAWALSVATFHLTHNPEIVARLRAELTASTPADGPVESRDWRQLERLPYLRGVVRESVRLGHGIVTRDPRIAREEVVRYKGWDVPEGTPVSMTTVDVLMNEGVFPGAKRFVPERWEEGGLERYFVPFGKGARGCVGINLAIAELYITIATLFSRFDFELFETDESDVEMEHAYLVPYAKWDSKGIRVKVVNDILKANSPR